MCKGPPLSGSMLAAFRFYANCQECRAPSRVSWKPLVKLGGSPKHAWWYARPDGQVVASSMHLVFLVPWTLNHLLTSGLQLWNRKSLSPKQHAIGAEGTSETSSR